jgi:addiction module HigA family antidote
VHSGEILRSEFLEPLHMSVYALAKALHVAAPRLNDIVLEKRGITPETAVRLARFFGTTPEFWMNLQTSYELPLAAKRAKREVQKIKPLELAGD